MALLRSCSEPRTLLHISLLELDDVTASHLCYTSCTGFQSGDGWSTKSHA